MFLGFRSLPRNIQITKLFLWFSHDKWLSFPVRFLCLLRKGRHFQSITLFMSSAQVLVYWKRDLFHGFVTNFICNYASHALFSLIHAQFVLRQMTTCFAISTDAQIWHRVWKTWPATSLDAASWWYTVRVFNYSFQNMCDAHEHGNTALATTWISWAIVLKCD